MGASGWEYVVPYQADLQTALDDLRRQVFADGDYIGPEILGLPGSNSLEGLEHEPYWEFMGTHGTHSVIDVTRVVHDVGEQDFATVFPFTDDEAEGLFGTLRPSRAEFERFHDEPIWHEYVAERWTGRALVLWKDDQPGEIVFWGYSGD